ncbi:rhomboid family protein [Opitutaceae bacterium EW11]|nr:rhomboid family protein [Opitutaceae bacterium EW11]
MRHATREAAGKCPACGGFFCRECLVEHDGRLLCAPCLARLAAAEAGPRRPPVGKRIRSGATLLAGAFALWLLFVGLAGLLLKLPPAFHDGTVWERPEFGKDEPEK